MDVMKINREKRLRRTLLLALENAGGGGVRGRGLCDLLEFDLDARAGAEAEAGGIAALVQRLCRDLVNGQRARAIDVRKFKDQRPGIDNTVYEITALGTALLAGQVDVDPLIEDERIG